MRSTIPLAALAAALLAPTTAPAVNLTLVSENAPYPGVTIQHYETTSPTTDSWVALIDLCTDYVHVEATRAPSGRQSTGGWAEDEGVQLASNGDFYRSSPLSVYGNAVGRGIPWPLELTGDDPGISWEWFYGRYGWIAFGPDFVEFTHTEWVKDNPGVFGGLADGWESTTVFPSVPPGTLAMVSGFPELVIEGQTYTCSSPTDSSCFPDRSDMRDRHPRTAMGITADRGTFILATVDGRTSASAGMYGAELADVMGQLGAYEAFNLDGGGSSQLWVQGDGYVNNHTGNNGGGTRSVANHWGAFAGLASGRPQRAGHCTTAAPCAVLPPEGGIVDDEGACFQKFGPGEWWRTEDEGHDGHLWWTNGFTSEQASNWAWWQLHPQDAGEYLVEYFATPEFAVWDAVPYAVRAGGVTTELTVDQAGASGWTELGAFDFDAGGGQWVALYDNATGAVGSDQHVVADAIRLTRLDLPKGDDDDVADDDDDVADDDDSGPQPDDDDSASDDDDTADDDDLTPPGGEGGWLPDQGGCCAADGEEVAAASPVALLVLGGLAGLRRRRGDRR